VNVSLSDGQYGQIAGRGNQPGGGN
jgi:hypothetical protein